MTRFCILTSALLMLCGTSISNTVLRCAPHEIYNKCAQVCTKTCSTYYLNLLYQCRCEPGCECEGDYIREEENGRCVKLQECDPKGFQCPTNMEYSESKQSEFTCSGRRDCNGKPGCYCKQGFYKNEENKCVEYHKC